MKDKVETKVTENAFESDGKTYTDFKFIIMELHGYGTVSFNPPLIINGFIEQGGNEALYWYDFGMECKVSVDPEFNFLTNYRENKNKDPIQTVLNTIKFDLVHAFNHYNGDPNYGSLHWALFGNLKDRADWYDYCEEVERPIQREFDFLS